MSHSDALTPLRRGLLRDDVYNSLRDAIVDGRLAPGEVVRDGELASSLGVSRTPVREALLRLGEAGLVRSQPGRSTTVSEIDLDAVRGAQSVVAAMHQLAVTEAASRLTPDDLATMRDANRRFAAAVEAGDVDGALAADDEFHAVPVAVAGNAALATVLDQFTPVVRRLERRRFASVAGRDSVDLHARLVDLCESGDVDGAALVSHETWQALAPLIPTLPSATPVAVDADPPRQN